MQMVSPVLLRSVSERIERGNCNYSALSDGRLSAGTRHLPFALCRRSYAGRIGSASIWRARGSALHPLDMAMDEAEDDALRVWSWAAQTVARGIARIDD